MAMRESCTKYFTSLYLRAYSSRAADPPSSPPFSPANHQHWILAPRVAERQRLPISGVHSSVVLESLPLPSVQPWMFTN